MYGWGDRRHFDPDQIIWSIPVGNLAFWIVFVVMKTSNAIGQWIKRKRRTRRCS